ncbi:MAG: amidohydrolase [Lentisphaeria bacterium]|nr:amidohydrolase [Lentisphaeria bacterium]
MRYFDIHAHIFPDKIAAKVVSTLESFYNFTWNGTGTVSDLLANMDKASVERAVIFSCATKPEQITAANSFLSDTQQRYPERFCAFGTIHPDCPDIDGVLKDIKERGLRGIKLHPDFQQIYIDEPAMMRIYGKLDATLPLIIHMGDPRTDFSSPHRLARVLERFPDLVVIAAHFGGYKEWDQAWKHLVGKNVFLDTSSSFPLLSPEEAVRIIRAHGVEKILFASDYPASDLENAIGDILKLGLSPQENEQIFHLNAERILGTL